MARMLERRRMASYFKRRCFHFHSCLFGAIRGCDELLRFGSVGGSEGAEDFVEVAFFGADFGYLPAVGGFENGPNEITIGIAGGEWIDARPEFTVFFFDDGGLTNVCDGGETLDKFWRVDAANGKGDGTAEVRPGFEFVGRAADDDLA